MFCNRKLFCLAALAAQTRPATNGAQLSNVSWAVWVSNWVSSHIKPGSALATPADMLSASFTTTQTQKRSLASSHVQSTQGIRSCFVPRYQCIPANFKPWGGRAYSLEQGSAGPRQKFSGFRCPRSCPAYTLPVHQQAVLAVLVLTFALLSMGQIWQFPMLIGPQRFGAGDKNQRWPTSAPGGYITPAAWGVPNAEERGTKSEVAHKWAGSLHNPCRLVG